MNANDRAILLICGLVGAGATLAAVSSYRFTLALLGVLGLAIVSLPYVLRHQPILSAWTLVWGSVALGFTGRAIAIVFDYPNHEVLVFLFFRDLSLAGLLLPSALAVVSLALLTVSYVSAFPHPKARHPRALAEFDGCPPAAISIAIAVLAAIGLVGTFGFISTTETSLELVSAKRTIVVDGIADSGGEGIFRTLSLCGFGALLLAQLSWQSVAPRLTFSRRVGLAALFALTVALPVYASIRADVLLAIVMSGALHTYFRPGRHKTKLVFGMGAFLFASNLLTTLRGLGQNRLVSLGDVFGWRAPVDGLLLARNFFDLSKIAQIVHGVPEKLDYAYGSSILAFVLAPIPRSIWANKPRVSGGPIIGQSLYDTAITGIPPGLTGELYWNFGLVGVLLGSVVFGSLLGRLDRRAWTSANRSVGGTFFFLVGVVPAGKNLLSVGIGFAAFQLVVAYVISRGINVLIALLKTSAPTRQLTRNSVIR